MTMKSACGEYECPCHDEAISLRADVERLKAEIDVRNDPTLLKRLSVTLVERLEKAEAEVERLNAEKSRAWELKDAAVATYIEVEGQRDRYRKALEDVQNTFNCRCVGVMENQKRHSLYCPISIAMKALALEIR